jgi:uncharacterized RDD family membrane protein YckC
MNESQRATISAGPLRRLGAMLYDLMLVVAVLIVATVPFVPFIGDKVLVPSEVGALAYAYWLWEALIVCGFFGFFWTQRGQTLGMQAWKLRIETPNGARPSWSDAILRVLAAIVPWLPACVVLAIAEHSSLRATLVPIGMSLLAIGFLNYFAAWFDPERRSVHDRWLGTRIVNRS